MQGNLFNSIKNKESFDLIVSNPPYIKSEDLTTLQEEVRWWEPEEALDGGVSGLDFYRYLKKASGYILKPGGHLVVEQGDHQSNEVRNLFLNDPLFSFIGFRNDLIGKERVSIIQKISPQKE